MMSEDNVIFFTFIVILKIRKDSGFVRSGCGHHPGVSSRVEIFPKDKIAQATL